jgi:hypothetical protein
VLDAEVPLELSRAVFSNSKSKFILGHDSTLREGETTGSPKQSGAVELTARQVHDRFGPAVLEEVREYGAVDVGRT